MSRLGAFLGFGLPIILIAVNLIWGYGGILVFILLMLWIGIAVFFSLPDESTGA
jgi:hypothetical protein